MVDLRDDDALLSEALAPHVPADRSPSDAGCYALAIAAPDAGYETHSRAWLEHYDSVPPYLQQIVDARRVVYVGRSSNVRARLSEHLRGEVRQATIPTVYEIGGVVGVDWGENTDHAERSYADELRQELRGDTYVHTR